MLGQAPQPETWSCGSTNVNWVQLEVLETQKAEMCLDLEERAGSASVWHTTQYAVVFTSTDKTESVWPGGLSGEQTTVSLL